MKKWKLLLRNFSLPTLNRSAEASVPLTRRVLPVLRSKAFATVGLESEDVTHAEPDPMRTELYRLIANEIQPGIPSSAQAADLFRLLTAQPTDDVAGAKLGRFTIRRWLGAGGFGVVFLAYDELLHRQVALKLPRVQSLAHREVRERFLREAEAAAQLHHPNVVPVFEAGEEQGICYIASAYCPGPTLDDWLAQQSEPVAVETAVAIVRPLAEAVQHAHQHRVLHRDIKPSNILLELPPDRLFRKRGLALWRARESLHKSDVPGEGQPPILTEPHSVGLVPKLTDFGLAKLLDTDGSMNGIRDMVGTPRYMSPEQATGNRDAMGPATDVFALGAVLYEVLCGVAPFAGVDQAQTLHRLFSERAVPLRRLRGDVPRDLEAICLKCLEKQSDDRYPTAQLLADDLRRFEQGQTTLARPLGSLESLRRWTLREPAVATLLAVIGVGLLSLLGLLVAYSQSLKTFNAEIQTALDNTRRAQRAVEVQRGRLGNLLYVSKIDRAHQAIQENDLLQASRLLRELESEASEVADNFVWRYLWNRVAVQGQEIQDSDAEVYDLQFSPSGERLAAGGADSVLRIYDGQSFSPLLSIATDQKEINAVAFSPDEQSIASAGDDGTVRLWDLSTRIPRLTIQAHDQLAYGVLFAPDGNTLITCGSDPVIRLWNAQTGEPLGTLEGHTRAVEAIAISPDGSYLASASSDTTARIWELATGQSRHVLEGHQGRVVAVAYCHHGDSVLTGGLDRTLRLWDAADAHCLQIENHVDSVTSVAFLRGDTVLAAADRGGSVHAWQRETDKPLEIPAATPLHSWKAHSGRAWKITATPEGTEVMTAGADGKVYHWERPPPTHQSLRFEGDHTIQDIVFDAKSTRLHFIDKATGVRTWDILSDQHGALMEQAAPGEPQPRCLCASPTGMLVLGFSDGSLQGFQLAAPHQRVALPSAWNTNPMGEIEAVAVSRDGQRMAAFSYARDATVVYDLIQSRLIGTFESYAQAMALSADGTRLAMSDGDDVVVWDIDRHQIIARFKGHASTINALQFSPDGRWLGSGSKDRHVRLWNLEDRTDSTILAGHRADIEAIVFSPDGRLLASGDTQGELKFWFLAEAAELVSIQSAAPIEKLVFSPDGNRLAMQSARGVEILNAAPAGFGSHAAPIHGEPERRTAPVSAP